MNAALVRSTQLVALMACIANSSAAQSHDAIVLVHGRNQTGGDWVSMAAPLQSTFGVPVLAPSLGRGASWSDQASSLHAALVNRASAFSVSHSNGGPVSRHYVRTFGQSARVTAQLTLGSPHLGAPIAANALNGQLFAWLGGTSAHLSSTFGFYWNNDPAFSENLPSWLWYTINFAAAGLNTMSYILGALGYYNAINTPVFHDLAPGSANVTALSEASFLAFEAAKTPRRTSVVTELTHAYQPYSMFFEHQSASTLKSAVITVSNSALYYYEYYRYHPDPYLRAFAGNWLLVADDLARVQLTWAEMTGALVYSRGIWTVTQSDGLIPWNRSFYSGAEAVTLTRQNYGDIPHPMQQHHFQVYSVVRARLIAAEIPLYVPPNPAPPPPFSIYINGSLTARPGNTCSYDGGSSDEKWSRLSEQQAM